MHCRSYTVDQASADQPTLDERVKPLSEPDEQLPSTGRSPF